MKKTKLNGSYLRIGLVRTPRPGFSFPVFGLIGLTLALAWCPGAQARQAATATATMTNGSLAGIMVTDGGLGYDTPPAVTFIGGGGSGATATTELSGGSVSNVIIQTAGSNYTSAPYVMISPPQLPATPATLNISLATKVTVSGQPWAVQAVQYANGMGKSNQWITLTNIVMGDGPYTLIDTDAAPTARFYQVVTVAAPGPDPARWAWLNPGTFTMGSPSNEYDRSSDESPQTQVTFTHGFWMERFEVTQGEYQAIVGTNNSSFNSDTNQPVEQVQWFDATNYCALLTAQEAAAGRIPGGYVYRLPTEAEWEYAARGGSTNRFFFGDDHDYTLLQNYAWFETNDNTTTHDIGGKEPNPYGMYDMAGNVWEWCADYYGPYPGGAVTDPTGPASGTNRVMRGGSFRFPGGDARPAARNFNPPDFQSEGIGIRVVLGPPLNQP